MRHLSGIFQSAGLQLGFHAFSIATIIIVGKAEGRAINKKFRKKNYATDVISFHGNLEEPVPSLGELVVCDDVLQRQAQEHELSWSEEFTYLVIHGILHLIGFTHESGGLGAKLMYQLQDRAFSKQISQR